METVRNEFWIPEDNMENFTQTMTKFTNKAVKAGHPPFTFEIVGSEMREVERYIEDTLYKLNIKHYAVVVQGQLPVIQEGFRFAGAIERVKEKNLVFCANPSLLSRLDEMRSRPNSCDHCNTNRKRNRVYILENEKGQFIQVGKSCMSDFLVPKSADYIASYYTTLKDIFETAYTRPKGNLNYIYHNTMDILKIVCTTIEEHGFVAIGTPDATAFRVQRDILWGKIPNYDESKIKHMIDKIKQYDGANSYISNMVTLLGEESVRHKDIRFLASVTKCYEGVLKKEQEDKEKQKKVQQEKQYQKSTYQGEIKERIERKVRVVDLFDIPGEFAWTTVLKMIDEQGNVYTWFTTSVLGEEVQKGAILHIRGTVKDHNMYKGVKQTILTRCKVTSIEEVTNHA